MGDVLAITGKFGWGIVDVEKEAYAGCDLGKSNSHRSKDFFGLTWDGAHIYTLGRMADHIKRYDKELRYMGNLYLPEQVMDGHQILWIDAYEEFVITDAKKDLIVIFNPRTLKTYSFPVRSPGVEESHVNSIYFDQASNCLHVVCHNRGQSCVKSYLYPNLSRPIAERWIGVKAHNLWFEDGILNTCSSANKRVVDEVGAVKYQSDGFVRGVAVTDGRIYMGQSGWRHQTGKYEFYGVGKRRCASIAVLDSAYTFIKEIFLPIGIKEIFDIRILNRFDHSHNKNAFWQTESSFPEFLFPDSFIK